MPCAHGGTPPRVSTACPPMSYFTTAPWKQSPLTQPRTLDDLRGISGIGAKKLERYGEALLKMTITDFQDT